MQEESKDKKDENETKEIRARIVSAPTSDLYAIYENYNNKHWLTPRWQRGDVWNKRKKKDFKETIMNKAEVGDHLPGVFVIFNLKGNKQLYISDGLQRTINAKNIYKELSKTSITYAKQMLKHIAVSVQHFEYINEKEARKDFVNLNQGTSFTNYEQGRTILCDLPDFDKWEKHVFDVLDMAMDGNAKRLGLKISSSRCKSDKLKRDNMALLLRYLIKDKEANSYRCSCKLTNSDFNDANIGKLIESRLVKCFSEMDISEAKKTIHEFNRFVDAEIALIETVWEEIDKKEWHSTVQTVTDATWRWLLACAIYRRNNNIPRPAHKEFLKAILIATKGRSSVSSKDNKVITYKLSDLSMLGGIQEHTKAYLDKAVGYRGGKRGRRKTQLKSGYDDAHKKALAIHGEGDTEPAPASDNRSLGVNYISKKLKKTKKVDKVEQKTKKVRKNKQDKQDKNQIEMSFKDNFEDNFGI